VTQAPALQRIAWGIGIVALTLSAANSFVATQADTCTMGSFDSLEAAIWDIPLLVVGFGALIAQPLPRRKWLMMIPALAGFAYHLVWTARFAKHYLIDHRAVCDLLTGESFDFDGREPEFLVLWAGISLLMVAGLPIALWRTFRISRQPLHEKP